MITAASQNPEVVFKDYSGAFQSMGFAKDLHIDVNPDYLGEAVSTSVNCRAVLMTSSDQGRLMQAIGSTPVAAALHRTYHDQVLCVARTSTGAVDPGGILRVVRRLVSPGPIRIY